MELRRDGVPISSLALGCRNMRSSKSPLASIPISYSLSRARLVETEGGREDDIWEQRILVWCSVCVCVCMHMHVCVTVYSVAMLTGCCESWHD